MLTLLEKILFIIAVIASGYLAFKASQRLVRIISIGHGKPDWTRGLGIESEPVQISLVAPSLHHTRFGFP